MTLYPGLYALYTGDYAGSSLVIWKGGSDVAHTIVQGSSFSAVYEILDNSGFYNDAKIKFKISGTFQIMEIH